VLIKNISQNKDGTLDFELKMEQQEADFLISFAINTLLNNGAIQINEEDEDTQVDLFEDFDGNLQ
jgi:hypothetical protein